MAAVGQALPDCLITQEAAYLPTTHDDGIWYFNLPGMEHSVQIESSDGMCPFLLETEDASGPTARTFASVNETVEVIIAALKAA